MSTASSIQGAPGQMVRAKKGSARKLALPSGRSAVLRFAGGREELEIRAPTGDVELQVLFTPNGPLVRLRGAELELTAVETVRIDCGRLEVNTKKDIHLAGQGGLQLEGQDLRVQTKGDMHFNGGVIRLNC